MGTNRTMIRDPHMQRTTILNTDKLVMLLIGGCTVFVIILIAFVFTAEKKAAGKLDQVVQYQPSDAQKPTVVFSTEVKDVGKMNVSDERSADFAVKNTGTKSLSLFNISSSCGCTAGTVTIKDDKSPEGSMHTKGSWVGSLSPGDTATVTIIYRPSIMPVKGDVSRSVYVETNDPDNKQLTFSIKAFVE